MLLTNVHQDYVWVLPGLPHDPLATKLYRGLDVPETFELLHYLVMVRVLENKDYSIFSLVPK